MVAPTDHVDDVNHQQLYSIDKLVGTPQFVKDAQLEDPGKIRDLPSTAFADAVRRKFPCHTKEATWLSNAYFSQCREAYQTKEAEAVKARLHKFANYFGIRGLLDQFDASWRKVAGYDAPGLQDSSYALVAEVDGQKVRRMPLVSPMAVKAAGEFLVANRSSYPYPVRRAVARNILKAAMRFDDMAKNGRVKFAGAEFGIYQFPPETLSYLEKAAGLGASHPKWVAEKIAQRVLLCGKNEALRLKLASVALAVSKMDSLDAGNAEKLAALIDSADNELGIRGNYHDGIDMPEEICYQVLSKEAEAVVASYVRLQTGKLVPLEALLSLPMHKFAALLGEDFTKSVQGEGIEVDPVKFAAVVQSLPRDDAVLIEQALGEIEKQAGVSFDAGEFDRDKWAQYLKKRGYRVSEQVGDQEPIANAQGTFI